MAEIPRLTRRTLIAAATLATAGWLAGCGQESGGIQASFKAIDITGAQYANQLTLNDPDGQARSLTEFKGKLVVVFFGYTQCPDVCPTTMAELAETKRLLGEDGHKVVGIFVSVDPDRDTAPLLKEYTANFGPDILGLRGTADEVAAAAKHFKVFYNKVPGRTETSYTIDHTAGSYVFDTEGRVRLFTRYGAGPEALAHDFRILLAEG